MAGLTQLLGYVLYLRVTKEANSSSWFIWTIAAVVELVSYYQMTNGDLGKNILPAVCAVACVFTFFFLLFRKGFGWPEPFDWVILALDVLITIRWACSSDPVEANLLYQFTTLISFAPIIKDQLTEVHPERPLAWFVWTIAYTLFLVSIWLELGTWEELAFPIVGIVTHLVVFVIAMWKLKALR